MMKKLLPALSGFMLLFICGCGYHMGSMMHPQVKTIGIANVRNDTTSYNAGFQLQQLLAEQFQLDGSLKVVNRKESDCILYATIVDAGYSEISASAVDSNIYQPVIWQVKVAVEFTVVIPGSREPLIPLRRVVGMTEFQSVADMETHRLNAVRQACRDAAKLIVQYTTEAW